MIAIISPNAQVTFRQNRDLENNTSSPAIAFDGGVLEISIGGGAFNDVILSGGSFVTGGYNTAVATQFGSPIAGRNAWSGSTSGAFIPSTVNLPPSAAGQNVVLRWRMASDSSVSKTGWRIDGISISRLSVWTDADAGTNRERQRQRRTPTPTPIGCSSGTLTENFDGVIAPTLPSGWSANNAIGPAPLWVTSTSGGPSPAFDTSPNSALVDDPGDVSDKMLDSAPITIANAGVIVSFKNNYDLEDGFDGGVLEISINGGAFTDIIAAGGSFVTGGYNGTISTDFGSPIMGRAAWTNISSGFITSAVILPPSATGQTIVLRWRMASDSSVGNSGWKIDTVTLNCGNGPTPTPAPTATPTPTPTPTPSPTPTPTPCPGSTTTFTERFDSVTAPALPPGWTASFSNGILQCPPTPPTPTPPAPSCALGSNWITTSFGPADSAPNTAFHSDPSCVTDSVLDSVSIPIVSTGAQVSFRNKYLTESTFDGGVLEIAIGGGGFTDIVAAGGSFVTGGYNTTIATGFGSPIAGRQAWSGTVPGSTFITSVAYLPGAAAGQNIKLRWRMATDCNTSGTGWWVDGVSVTDCIPATPSPPPPTPTSSPVNISGSAFLCAAAVPTPTPNVALSNVTMTLTGTSSGTTSTDGTGFYQFSGLLGAGNFTITPTKARRLTGSPGINTVDVVAEQNHALGRVFLTGCRLTAGDCAGTVGITTVDVLAVQAFALGRTVPAQLGTVGIHIFSPTARTYTPLSTSQTNQNFDTIIIGDVANPIATPPPRPGGPAPEKPVAGSVAKVALTGCDQESWCEQFHRCHYHDRCRCVE